MSGYRRFIDNPRWLIAFMVGWTLAVTCVSSCRGAEITIRDQQGSYTLQLSQGTFVVAVATESGTVSKIDVQVLGGPKPSPTPTPNPTPTPIPTPTPTPNPAPPQPQLEGLALEVFNRCPSRSYANATRLAANFRVVANSIAVGVLKKPEEVSESIKKLNSSSAAGGEWPAFGTWLGTVMAGSDQSMEGLRKTFDAIATGLEAKARN